MKYLNRDSLERLCPEDFHDQSPYPWAEIPATLTPEGFHALGETLPNASQFTQIVFRKTAHGGVGHDRLSLHYRQGLQLADPWLEFLAELQGESYLSFVRRMCGVGEGRRLLPTFEWYYAWQGCGVAPHCDARRKLATHIFYFNTEDDWRPEWGGEILILDHEGRLRRRALPDFADLKVAACLSAQGNASLFFQRGAHSWHGVHPLTSAPGSLRKIFICTIDLPTWQVWWRRIRRKDPDGFPLVAI